MVHPLAGIALAQLFADQPRHHASHPLFANNSVARVEERGAARLELHAVENKLHDEGVAVLGDKGLRLAVRKVFTWTVEIAFWDGAVLKRLGGEEVIREAMLLDKPLGHNPKNLRPDLANRVDTPVTGLVKGLVR